MVTVIIVNWNGGSLLIECLKHLLRQDLPPSKILVMDNGSSDDSAYLAQQLPDVSVHFLNANLGFAAANNRALAECDTKYVALVNPDAFAEADWLQQLIDAAEKNPGYSMFASRQVMDADDHLLDGDGDVYHVSGLVWREGHGRPKTRAGQEPQEIFSPCAAAALYRREALIAANGFDEDFFCYVEDVDLGFRLRLMGHRCLRVPAAVVRHVGSATSGGQHSDFAIYHGHRNLLWAFVKNMPGWLFWALLPLHVAMNLVAILVFIGRGKGKVILKAKGHALLGLPRMWAKRREIQGKRTATVGEIWRVLDKRMIPGRYDPMEKWRRRWITR